MTGKPGSEGPDIEGLRKFAESRDRDVAPFFVGREDEISLVQRVCESALESTADGQPAQSCTIVFQGAPGAGKTSLLNHLKEVYGDQPGWIETMLQRTGIKDSAGSSFQPLAVTVDMGSVHDEARLVEKLAWALDERIEQDFRTTGEKRKSVRADGAFGVGGIRAQFGFDLGRGASVAPPTPSLDNLARAMAGRGLRSPILLLTDEIQNVTPGRHDDLLGLLHRGSHGLPIVPVYAGLGDSWEALGRCGLTRPSSGHVRNIAGLAQDEARQAMGLFFERYRVEGEEAHKDAWAAALAEDSDCWPEHLHTAMQGLAETLADCAGQLFGLDDPRAARARAAGLELRTESYGPRQSDEMAVARILVARLMAEIPVDPQYGMEPDQVSDLLQSLDREGRSAAGRRLPEDMSAGGFLKHLVHQGVLQARSHRDRRLHCPIPSLRYWLIRRGGNGGQVPPPPMYDPDTGERIGSEGRLGA